MANKYNDILALVNAGNQMGLSNTIKRDYGIPLDFTSIQESYDAAVIYAAKSTLAYVGQTVAVGGKLYIISDVSAADKYHADDGQDYDNYLAEVGSKIGGDGDTIELDGQTLKLAGLTSLDNSKTYVPSLVNGKLVWAEPDTSTAEGQTQEINALKTRTAELEATVNGVEAAEGVEAKEGLVDKVASNTQAIADETAAREAAIGVASKPESAEGAGDAVVATGVYKAIEEAEARAKAYADANDADTKYDDTKVKEDIATNTSAIETLQTSVGNVYTKTEVDDKFEEVNNTIAGITHFTTEVVSSTDEVTEAGVLYLIKDESVEGVDKYNEYLFIEGQGAVLIGDTTTDLKDYVTNTALATELAKYTTTEGLNTVLAPYAKTETVNAALDLKANAADVVNNTTFEQFKTDNTNAIAAARTGAVSDVEDKGYAVATEVAETYAEKATTLAGYGITDAYTKAEAMGKTEAYTKAEVDRMLDEVTGGSSETADSVKRALDGYIQNIDTELYGAETVARWTTTDGEGNTTYNPQYSVDDSRVDTALSNAATAKAQADKGVQDAATAKSVADAAQAQANTNKADIAALTTQITERNAAVDSEIAALKAKDTTIEGEISGLKTTTGEHATTIGDHTSRIAALETKDTQLEGQISTIDGKFANYSDTTAMNKAIDDKIAAIPAVDLSDYAKSDDVESTYAKIGDAYTKAEADEEFMTEGEVDARINALIVASDPEGGKTITDIQNLVKYVDENAGDIAALVTATDANTAKLAGIDTTVKGYVDNAISALVMPKASEEITIDEDGTLGLGKVSTDKLEMGTNTLVIDGGNATA